MHREIGAEVMVPAFLSLEAEVLQGLGRTAEATAAVDEALSVAHQSGHHYWEAELHRLSGVLASVSETPPERDAESHFLRAVEIARRQRARTLELRATVGLCRLWVSQGKVVEAYAALTAIYGWFTEGFETPDLRAAKSLLDELATRSNA